MRTCSSTIKGCVLDTVDDELILHLDAANSPCRKPRQSVVSDNKSDKAHDRVPQRLGETKEERVISTSTDDGLKGIPGYECRARKGAKNGPLRTESR